MNYIHTFESLSAQTEYYKSTAYTEPCVSSVMGENVKFNIGSNGHPFVDLGLPSGTLWATINVGATGETDAGLYFAWGETSGYTTEQIGREKNFSWSDYKYGAYDSNDMHDRGMTKYNSTDGKTSLDAEDDAVSVNWGGKWKMPTQDQMDELMANTTSAFTTVNGVSGMMCTSIVDNTKYVFFPYAGYYENGEFRGPGTYWSSSLETSNVILAWQLFFRSDVAETGQDSRFMGRPVRGVLG